MKDNYQEYLKLLKEYISFKSISTDHSFKGDIAQTVVWLEEYIVHNGGEVKIFQRGNTNPVVFGHFKVDEKLPTVLVYGHYDVQPGEKSDGWTTESPFKIEEKTWDRAKRLVGRGVVDNKGQNLIHLFTVAKLYKSKQLKYNVKIMLEGNEESGNPDLPVILSENKKAFTCDYVLVSDGEIVKDFPCMESTLRGGANIRVEFTTGRNNLHSGLFGGAVPSASLELVKMLGTLKGKDNKVLVKDFYNKVPKPSKAVIMNNKNIGSEKYALKTSQTNNLMLQKGLDFYTSVGNMPTLEISGIKTGYIGEGFANIVPAHSEARINIRTVPNQKTKDVVELVKKHIRKVTPRYVDVKIHGEGHGDAILLDNKSEVAKDIQKILEKTYKKKVISKYVGGSIPILGDFQKILGSKVISVSLGNDDCHMHGVDENFKVDLIEKGLKFAENFWKK
jgi:acetylornithine deacetylase/succinyl-diaminopimelate desuccinylase-like protein